MKGEMKSIVIHGVKYIAVDTLLEDGGDCSECDIYKAMIPRRMIDLPLCLHDKYKKVNDSCCDKFEKGIKRIWKKQ